MTHTCPACGDSNLTLVAQREDIPYGRSAVVSVIIPVRGCNTCDMKWTDEYGEVIRNFAVTEAAKKQNL